MDDEISALGGRLRGLGRNFRLVRQHLSGTAAELPVGAVTMLQHIDELSVSCHGRELAARTALDPSTVSRVVASLVARGLVERRADPADGRVSVLGLTPGGRAALASAHARHARLLARALTGWAPEEIDALTALLDRFNRDLDLSLTDADTDADTLETAR